MFQFALLASVVVLLFNNCTHAANLSYNGQNITVRRNSQFTRSDHFVLNTLVDVSFYQCISECNARERCKAIEYRRAFKLCSLRTHGSGVEQKAGVLTVVDLDKLYTSQCGNRTCGEDETCNATTGECEITECGYPDIGQVIEGNRYTVGSRLVIECVKHGNVTLTCDATGTWVSSKVTLKTGVTCRHIKLRDANAKTGVYKNSLNMSIFCDFDSDGLGYLVFQRRYNGSVDFYRNWTEYKMGFGDPNGEFWFGLEHMHTILNYSCAPFILRIDLWDWKPEHRYAIYNEFDLTGEDLNYRLHCVNYEGNADDGMNAVQAKYSDFSAHAKPFTTFDQDNDNYTKNCAKEFHGAWWYGGKQATNSCYKANLNGRYYEGGQKNTDDPYSQGIVWYTWTDDRHHFLKRTKMMMRENYTEV